MLTGALTLLSPVAAQAHSLDSSTISLHLQDDGSADATVSIALATLEEAMGTDLTDSVASSEAIVAYLDEHLAVAGADGTVWAETWSTPVLETVEGIESVRVDVALDTADADADASGLTVAYDAVIESDAAHEAVVVLTDAAGEVSTAGVLDAATPVLRIGETVAPGLADMVGFGLHHVLEGADHLLFLITLRLVAPLAVVAGRCVRRDGVARAVGRVALVATAFTVGHSLTLIASALGWIVLPVTPVEVLIAASVAVAAVHAIRPLVRGGEALIAGAFGLVHGLAFAGILTDLGLDGSLSIATLLAFNVGVELAQLLTIALVLPSLLLLSRTRFFTLLRIGVAAVAAPAASAWVLDRLGVLANPFSAVEDALVADAWVVVVVLAAVAVIGALAERVLTRREGVPAPVAPSAPDQPVLARH